MRIKSLPIKKETGLASVTQLVGLTKPDLVFNIWPFTEKSAHLCPRYRSSDDQQRLTPGKASLFPGLDPRS